MPTFFGDCQLTVKNFNFIQWLCSLYNQRTVGECTVLCITSTLCFHSFPFPIHVHIIFSLTPARGTLPGRQWVPWYGTVWSSRGVVPPSKSVLDNLLIDDMDSKYKKNCSFPFSLSICQKKHNVNLLSLGLKELHDSR